MSGMAFQTDWGRIGVGSVFAPEAAGDGKRAFIERSWPEGVLKREASVDLWCRSVAPSARLGRALRSGKTDFAAFASAYMRELDENPGSADFLLGMLDLLKKTDVTLLYVHGDEKENAALVAAEWLARECGTVAEADREKQKLRRAAAERIKGLRQNTVRENSSGIASVLLHSEAYRGAGSVLCYVSVGKEPDTSSIIARALADGKEVYVPKCGPHPSMRAVRITSPEELRPGLLGIPEPATEGPAVERVDLAVVPCMAATLHGNRLGHGGGYYDSFLRGKSIRSVCLCHPELLFDDIPGTRYDVQMDAVALPGRLARCF